MNLIKVEAKNLLSVSSVLEFVVNWNDVCNRYKDNDYGSEEFFRYVPRDSPQFLIYNVDGIIINVNELTHTILFYTYQCWFKQSSLTVALHFKKWSLCWLNNALHSAISKQFSMSFRFEQKRYEIIRHGGVLIELSDTFDTFDNSMRNNSLNTSKTLNYIEHNNNTKNKKSNQIERDSEWSWNLLHQTIKDTK